MRACQNRRVHRLLRVVLVLTLAGMIVTLTGCGDDGAPEPAGEHAGDEFPSVVDAVAQWDVPTWTVSVTISSPYDGPTRYADAWRLVGPDGEVLAVRELTHHHADEQPFTRSLAGIAIPDDVDRVTVQGRDLVNGWGGATVELLLER